MKEVRGAFSRCRSPYIQIEACRSDSYRVFAEKAAQNKELLPLKLNGAMILDEPITVKGKSRPWTLGNYLLLMKKAPNLEWHNIPTLLK